MQLAARDHKVRTLASAHDERVEPAWVLVLFAPHDLQLGIRAARSDSAPSAAQREVWSGGDAVQVFCHRHTATLASVNIMPARWFLRRVHQLMQ